MELHGSIEHSRRSGVHLTECKADSAAQCEKTKELNERGYKSEN